MVIWGGSSISITIFPFCRFWAWFLPFACTDQLDTRRYNNIRKHGNGWGQVFSELDKRENLRLKIINYGSLFLFRPRSICLIRRKEFFKIWLSHFSLKAEYFSRMPALWWPRTRPVTDPYFKVGEWEEGGTGWGLSLRDTSPRFKPGPIFGVHSGHCKIGIGRNILWTFPWCYVRGNCYFNYFLRHVSLAKQTRRVYGTPLLWSESRSI